MAQIKHYPGIRQMRADASSYIQHFRNGKRVRAGRGLAFWFMPDGASISEIPTDDRQMPFILKGQSADFQELTVQGTVVWRISDPQALGDRIDFTIDLTSGLPIGNPIDQINAVLVGLVRQFTYGYLQQSGVRALLTAGAAPVQEIVSQSLAADPTLPSMGLEAVGVNIADLAPTSELARALQAPTFESLQQQADEASFSRRALAVEKERAIAENELNNQIELSARQKDLIERESANDRFKMEASTATRKVNAEGEAEMQTLKAEAEAQSIRVVELAKADAEQARMNVFSNVPPAVLLALAAQEFAGKVNAIDNLTVTPDMLTGLMTQVGGLLNGVPTPRPLGEER
ncbi:SPFH domain-containing protein [Pyruvatibacter sp.]|uniref:SPFH domain-containing protein n=1 Tax=Pyruvatibacter sp. TaxID=1981328 RepID=UPI003266CC6D